MREEDERRSDDKIGFGLVIPLHWHSFNSIDSLLIARPIHSIEKEAIVIACVSGMIRPAKSKGRKRKERQKGRQSASEFSCSLLLSTVAANAIQRHEDEISILS
jgi:hypothetical protein